MKTKSLILALLLTSVPALAWDVPGHFIVAKIAYDYLNPHARAKVDSLSAKLHLEGHTYNAVNIAGWADQIKRANPDEESLAGHFKKWHFIDLSLNPGGPDLIGHPPTLTDKDGTVVEGLKLCEAVIGDSQKKNGIVPNETVALALIIHLVGDLHQPLHCTTNYFNTPQNAHKDDGGGNSVKVTNFKDKYAELHQFWDEAYKMNFNPDKETVEADPDWDPFSITPTSKELIDLEAEVLAEKRTIAVNLDGDYYKAWALETHEIGIKQAYGELGSDEYNKLAVTIKESYEEKAKKVARRQMCLAGLRLAAVLNKLYP